MCPNSKYCEVLPRADHDYELLLFCQKTLLLLTLNIAKSVLQADVASEEAVNVRAKSKRQQKSHIPCCRVKRSTINRREMCGLGLNKTSTHLV